MSRVLLHFFKIVILWVVSGGVGEGGGLKGQKWSKIKILSVGLHISGIIQHMILIYVSHIENDNISRGFLIFSKF